MPCLLGSPTKALGLRHEPFPQAPTLLALLKSVIFSCQDIGPGTALSAEDTDPPVPHENTQMRFQMIPVRAVKKC